MTQRIIKFRAWTGEKMRKCNVIGGKASMDWGPTNAPLMQYTGLLDKNGKEIWEGDILKLAEGDDGSLYVCIVCWNEKTAAFAARKVEEDQPYCDHMYGSNIGEVIGDIYSTPELLK